MKVIRDWAVPKIVKEVCSFLGMVSYYHWFIDKFAKLATLLHDLTEKDIRYFWTSSQQRAFKDLKHMLTTVLVLILLDLAKPYVIVSDANDTTIGRVLLQDHGARLQPITFLNHKLSRIERNYSPYERELAVVVYMLI